VNSFVTRITSAEIAISTSTVSDLLNRRVFDYPGAPLKKNSISAEQGKIIEKGVMHKGVDVPFEVKGALDVNAAGDVRLRAEKVEAAHVPAKGLLHLFGEDLSKLVNLKRDRGVRIEGDDIILSPGKMLPPPKMEGKVAFGVRPVRERLGWHRRVVDGGRASLIEEPSVGFAEVGAHALDILFGERLAQVREFDARCAGGDVRNGVCGDLLVARFQPVLGDELVALLLLVSGLDDDVFAERDACALTAHAEDADGVGVVPAAAGSDEQSEFVVLHATRVVVDRDELTLCIKSDIDAKFVWSLSDGPQVDGVVD
jgi:hypothetical protein